jgi:S-DNA-T family DNA segregation ATPase FtsK/SpoIIIE
MVQLAVTYPPDALHFYVLDLGGRNLSGLSRLPGVGDVIMPDDEAYEERLNRLMEHLEGTLQARKVALGAADASSLAAYNATHPGAPLPAIAVLIDNFAELKENFESLIDDRLIPLLRQGRSYGLHFIVTAADPGGIPSRVYNLFGQRLTFTLADSGSYLDVVGRGAPVIGDLPGRGLARVDGRPLAFQAALPVETEEESEGARLRRLAEAMRAAWPGATPEPIRILPRDIPLSEALAHITDLDGQEPEAVLGIDNDLRPARFNLQRNGPHFAIVGPPLSGKTTALLNWVLSLAYLHGPEQVSFVLFDLNRKFVRYGGQASLAALPHVLAVVHEASELPTLVEQVAVECRAMAERPGDRRLFLVIDNFDDFAEEVEREREASEALNDLAQLANRHGTDGLHIVLAGLLDAPSPLKNRVLSGGYGVGLRNADSLATLRAYTSNFKDLPAGRGHIVSAGQLTRLQIAQPYSDSTTKAVELDGWIVAIQERHGDEAPAQWVEPLAAGGSGDGALTGGVSDESKAEAAANGRVNKELLALIKKAVSKISEQQGVPLADLGMDLDAMEEADVLRLAETFLSADDLAL